MFLFKKFSAQSFRFHDKKVVLAQLTKDDSTVKRESGDGSQPFSNTKSKISA
jgi:hypothetical protein